MLNTKICAAIAAAAVITLLGGICPAYATASPFSDLPTSNWAYPYVYESYEDGVMTGVHTNDDGTIEFSPKSPLTVAEWGIMLVRAFYADEVSSANRTNWYDLEMSVLKSHGVFDGITNPEVLRVIHRSEMSVMIYNLLKAKGCTMPTSAELSTVSIPDINDIPANYQDAVRTCYYLGIINGKTVDGVIKFAGEDTLSRAEAAKVYVTVKEQLAKLGKTPGTSNPDPTPATGTTVGTMRDTPLTTSDLANAEALIANNVPITEYWASLPMDVRNICDRNYFNSAIQTVKDSQKILSEGEFFSALAYNSLNQYYNYAVVEYNSANTATNVDYAVGLLSCGGVYKAWGSSSRGYRIFTVKPLDDATMAVIAPIMARISPDMSDRQKAEFCVDAVCAQIDYEINGGANWTNGKETAGCEGYASMLKTLLCAAGIPAINCSGTVSGGAHAWLQVKLKDEDNWVILDGTITEYNPNVKVMTFSEHEGYYNYNHSLNEADTILVARAIVDTAM